MNASDITKLKQNQTLYSALYNPTVFESIVISTIYPISSIGGITPVTSYNSSIQTQYLYVCNPTFISYDMINNINNGQYICGGKTLSELSWQNTHSTTIYSNFYSTNSTSVLTTSTIILTGPGPVICPLVNFYQGTYLSHFCDVCNNYAPYSDDNCCQTCGQ